MRLIVTSDSHGAADRLVRAAENQPEAAVLIFLGDGEADLDALRRAVPNLKRIAVSGNCDSRYTDLPETELMTFAGTRVMMTHGHRFSVKSGLDGLLAAAKKCRADIALFGHTHTPYSGYEGGVRLFNPGSVREGSYGVIDRTPAGLFCFHCRI